MPAKVVKPLPAAPPAPPPGWDLVRKQAEEVIDRRFKVRKVKVEYQVKFIRVEDDWWYVGVDLKKRPADPIAFYYGMAEAEIELHDKKHLKIALVPMI